MRLEAALLRSRVARRILILFVCCALLPIAALAFLSFNHVTQQLHEQSQRRRLQESKAAGMAIVQRLMLLQAEMRMVAADMKSAHSPSIPQLSTGLSKSLEEPFEGLVMTTPEREESPLLGRVQAPLELTSEEKEHLRSDRALLTIRHGPGPMPHVLMALALDARDLTRGVLWGEIDPKYLWAIVSEEELPSMTEICVLDASNQVLYSSLPITSPSPGQVHFDMERTISGDFGWHSHARAYLASYRAIFLKATFHTPYWIVVMSEPKSYVLAPLARFKRTFPFVILVALLVVLLLSVIQIRRNLVPLDRLREGTRRIAGKDFESRVSVHSGDEFEELASSFNAMAGQLGRQFHVLTTAAEIDRAILSALDTEKIVDTVLNRMREVFPCDRVSVTLLDSNGNGKGRTRIMDDAHLCEKRVVDTEVSPEDTGIFQDHPEWVFVNNDGDVPRLLASLGAREVKSALILPLFVKKRLAGLITLGHREFYPYDSEELAQARQLADQVAVALSNARLIEELDQLNWGTLKALARTIDAKSPWTAGHSERMTQLALKIGSAMGLPREELDNLQRGGLLHDIGKIGVPASILNKAGPLTPEEHEVIMHHPRIGARILEPIPAYATVLPMVLQHHERFDGKGYPDGLAGEAICLGARIFAVADVFDSLTSGRPYRTAMDCEEVIEMIGQWSGSMFDAQVVDAFMEVMGRDRTEVQSLSVFQQA